MCDGGGCVWQGTASGLKGRRPWHIDTPRPLKPLMFEVISLLYGLMALGEDGFPPAFYKQTNDGE